MHRVLFVCTGNTCRSPMAEAILKNKKFKDIEVRSAGVYAADGRSASSQAIQVLDEANILHAHRARLLREEDLDWATLILTMTRSHKMAIVQNYEKAADKTFTLKEFAESEDGLDVSDPFGGSVEIYRRTYKELENLIEKAVKKVHE